MSARILIVEDEEPLTHAAALQPRSRRLRGRDRGARRRGRHQAEGSNCPIWSFLTGCCPACRASSSAAGLRARAGNAAAADHHADGAGRGERKAFADWPPAPTTISSSRSRCRSCWRACARCCAAPTPSVSPPFCISATSNSTAKRSASRAAAMPSILGRPNSACSNSCWSGRAGCSRASNCSTASGARDIYIDDRTVDVHVGRLRKALNRGQSADPIRTVRGSGYALDDRFGRAN